MLKKLEKNGEEDKERSKELLVNTGPGHIRYRQKLQHKPTHTFTTK